MFITIMSLAELPTFYMGINAQRPTSNGGSAAERRTLVGRLLGTKADKCPHPLNNRAFVLPH